MTFDEILALTEIDLEVLAAQKSRVFLVGNWRPTRGDDVELYLFTDDPSLDPAFLRNFTDGRRHGLDHDEFLRTVRPGVVETRGSVGGYDCVVLSAPSGQTLPVRAGAGAGVAVRDLGPGSYWARRADSRSVQPVFGQGDPSGGPGAAGDDAERGRTVLVRIAHGLRTWLGFQPRFRELVQAFSRLLARCGHDTGTGLVAFAAGGPLPAGTAEALVEYLLDPDDRRPFDPGAAGLDFNQAPWTPLARDAARRATFAHVVTAFRDVALGHDAGSFNELLFNGSTLSEHARAVFEAAGDLGPAFRGARDAFFDLVQHLDDPVIRAMPGEWVVEALYGLDEAAGPAGEDGEQARDERVTRILTGETPCPDVRPLEPRLTPGEREARGRELSEAFDRMVRAAVEADPAEADRLVAPLSPALAARVLEVRNDPARQSRLRQLSGFDREPEVFRAFLQSVRLTMLEALMPALFRAPRTTLADLSRRVESKFLTTFLTAVLLEGPLTDDLSRVGERLAESWGADAGATGAGGFDDLVGRLFTDVLGALDQERTFRELREGLEVLDRTRPLLEAPAGAGRRVTLNGVVALRPASDPVAPGGDGGSLARTPISPAALKPRLTDAVSQAVARRLAAPAADGGAGAADGAPGAHGSRIDAAAGEAVPALRPKAPTPRQVSQWVQTTLSLLWSDRAFVATLAEDAEALDRAFSKVYQAYVNNPNLTRFRRDVEVMFLASLMRLHAPALGIDRHSGSPLFNMLLDLHEAVDPESPDPRDFLREYPLSNYFDGLDTGGVRDLRTSLSVQAGKSLRNIVGATAQALGVRHVLQSARRHNPRAQVVVVNGTRQAFLRWLTRDNLTADQGLGRLRSHHLSATGGASLRSLIPGLIVFADDTAFADDGARAFIANELAAWSPSNDGMTVVLPPLVFSTGPQGQGRDWVKEGREVAAAAAAAPAPCLVLGPAARVNPAGDVFPTTVPAGYALAAWMLTGRDPGLLYWNVPEVSRGRFRSVGYGTAPLAESFGRVLWGLPGDTYSLAADLYLTRVMTVLAAAATSGRAGLNLAGFYRNVYRDWNDPQTRMTHEGSRVLGPALPGGDALSFWVGNPVARAAEGGDGDGPPPIRSVVVHPPADPRTNHRPDPREVTDVAWVNTLRARANLP